jgi:hypothetical protein
VRLQVVAHAGVVLLRKSIHSIATRQRAEGRGQSTEIAWLVCFHVYVCMYVYVCACNHSCPTSWCPMTSARARSSELTPACGIIEVATRPTSPHYAICMEEWVLTFVARSFHCLLSRRGPAGTMQ